MSLYIEAEAADPQLFNGSDAAEVDPMAIPLAESLSAAYVLRLDAYHRELAQAFGTQPPEHADLPESSFPRLPRSSDETEAIIFDGDLFGVLLDIYIFEGWGALEMIESDLTGKARPEGEPERPSGGTPSLVWPAAYKFFIYCRNMIALLVAAELIAIERRATSLIVARLSVTAVKVETAWKKDFGITRELIRSTSTPLDVPLDDSAVYMFAQKQLMATLTTAIGDVVDARVAYEELLESISHLRDALMTVTAKIERRQRHGAKAPAAQIAQREQLIASLAQKSALRAASEGYVAAMKAVVGMNCPLALLVVDGLKPKFTQDQLEAALGAVLWEVYGHLDELGAGITPGESRVRQMLPDLTRAAGGELIDPRYVQTLVVPAGGPEAFVARAAIAGLARDRGLLPLLHSTTWQLMQQQDLGPGTFGYVVIHRYLETLEVWMKRIAAHEKSVEEFLSVFNRGSAALSIALLVTPLAELAPAIRTISIVGDLVMIAYQISSVTTMMARLDESLAARLLEPDAYAIANLARLGELVVARAELANQLTQTLVLELLGVIAAGHWKIVQKLMVTRGFLLSVQAVMGDQSG